MSDGIVSQKKKPIPTHLEPGLGLGVAGLSCARFSYRDTFESLQKIFLVPGFTLLKKEPFSSAALSFQPKKVQPEDSFTSLLLSEKIERVFSWVLG